MATICPYEKRCENCDFHRPDEDRGGEKSCWLKTDMKENKIKPEVLEDIQLRYLKMYLEAKEE